MDKRKMVLPERIELSTSPFITLVLSYPIFGALEKTPQTRLCAGPSLHPSSGGLKPTEGRMSPVWPLHLSHMAREDTNTTRTWLGITTKVRLPRL